MKIHKNLIIGLIIFSNLLVAQELPPPERKYNVYKVDNFRELRVVPSYTLGAPSGMANTKGLMFLAFSGIATDGDVDGAFSTGISYGNAYKLGGHISLGIGSIDPRDGGAGNRGTLSASIGHNFKEDLLGVSFGVTSLNLWHDNEKDYDSSPSFYLSATKLIPNNLSPLVLTLGVGNNNFSDINYLGDKKKRIYPFAAGAIYLIPQVSLIGDWTSNILTIGVGISPFPKLPISINLGAYDVTKEREEKKISLIGSIAVGFRI